MASTLSKNASRLLFVGVPETPYIERLSLHRPVPSPHDNSELINRRLIRGDKTLRKTPRLRPAAGTIANRDMRNMSENGKDLARPILDELPNQDGTPGRRHLHTSAASATSGTTGEM